MPAPAPSGRGGPPRDSKTGGHGRSYGLVLVAFVVSVLLWALIVLAVDLFSR